jgi:hypothetical protein
MKVTVFSAQRYDQQFFNKINAQQFLARGEYVELDALPVNTSRGARVETAAV